MKYFFFFLSLCLVLPATAKSPKFPVPRLNPPSKPLVPKQKPLNPPNRPLNPRSGTYYHSLNPKPDPFGKPRRHPGTNRQDPFAL